MPAPAPKHTPAPATAPTPAPEPTPAPAPAHTQVRLTFMLADEDSNGYVERDELVTFCSLCLDAGLIHADVRKRMLCKMRSTRDSLAAWGGVALGSAPLGFAPLDVPGPSLWACELAEECVAAATRNPKVPELMDGD